MPSALYIGVGVGSTLLVSALFVHHYIHSRNLRRAFVKNRVNVVNPLNQVPVTVPWSREPTWNLRETIRNEFPPLSLRGTN